MRDSRHRRLAGLERERGAAAVEFALVLPILIVILMGIIDFGLYFYNDLQLTHVARDAARYLSVNNGPEATATIEAAKSRLVSASITSQAVTAAASPRAASKITLTATYRFVTPLPQLAHIGSSANIDASAVMMRE